MIGVLAIWIIAGDGGDCCAIIITVMASVRKDNR
jgi:hypothetical protein